MSDFFSENGLLIFIFLVIIIFIIKYLLRLSIVKQNVSFAILKIPYFGELVRKIVLLRFCTAFELLLKAHTPMAESLSLLQKMITFYPITISFEGIKSNIQKGESLHSSLKKYPIYDKRLVSLVGVAEQVNRLDQTFESLKEQYTEEINYKTTMMGNILEPALIILVGAIVGVILVSMYLPIFEFSSSVGS